MDCHFTNLIHATPVLNRHEFTDKIYSCTFRVLKHFNVSSVKTFGDIRTADGYKTDQSTACWWKNWQTYCLLVMLFIVMLRVLCQVLFTQRAWADRRRVVDHQGDQQTGILLHNCHASAHDHLNELLPPHKWGTNLLARETTCSPLRGQPDSALDTHILHRFYSVTFWLSRPVPINYFQVCFNWQNPTLAWEEWLHLHSVFLKRAPKWLPSCLMKL